MSDVHPDIYVKFHINAVKSGLVADMGAELIQTMIVLASFMDGAGRCFPSQTLIAERLGVSRETANRRIAKLLRYRWRGEPIITAEKQRTAAGWERTIYTIREVSGFTIY